MPFLLQKVFPRWPSSIFHRFWRAIRGRAERADHLVFISAALFFTLFIPIRTAFQFGGDEGYELIKASLASKGYRLYEEIWNDQPPFYTLLLVRVFRVFGHSIAAARLVSVGFSVLLLVIVTRWVRRNEGALTGLLAALFLAMSQTYILQSVSAMIELPSFAVAMGGAFVLLDSRPGSPVEGRRMAMAGILFGLACSIKLTALLVAGAAVCSYLIQRDDLPFRKRAAATAITAAMAAVAVAAAAQPDLFRMLRTAWSSHFSSARDADAIGGYSPYLLLRGQAGLLILSAGALALERKNWRGRLAFPAILFLLMLAVHAVHRPFWYYYALHFCFPLSWLGAVGVVQLSRNLDKSLRRRNPGRMLATSSVLATALLILATKIASDWETLRFEVFNAPRIDETPHIAEMRAYRESDWVFTDRPIFAFHAGKLIPPNVAVLPLKRLQNDELPSGEALAAFQLYKPGQILLLGAVRFSPEVHRYISAHYRQVPDPGPGARWLRIKEMD